MSSLKRIFEANVDFPEEEEEEEAFQTQSLREERMQKQID